MARLAAQLRIAERKSITRSEAVNIGTGRATTINTLARLFANLFGKKTVTPIHVKARHADVIRSCADTARSKKILGFIPKIDLRDGLKLLTDSLRFNAI